jgi:hypothetical protein
MNNDKFNKILNYGDWSFDNLGINFAYFEIKILLVHKKIINLKL